MNDATREGPRCAVCHGTRRGAEQLIPTEAVTPSVRAQLPPEARDGPICAACLASARMADMTARIEREHSALGEVEKGLAEQITKGRRAARHRDADAAPTYGQRLADAVARVGGSWPFVAGAGLVIAVWMAINGALSGAAFDPFPYILLNLVLSCLAALQAPIIMMSQNRASERDRRAADLDFQVNLKAEMEIAMLHAKLDHLMQARWESLLELQDMQLQLLRALHERLDASRDQAVQGPA